MSRYEARGPEPTSPRPTAAGTRPATPPVSHPSAPRPLLPRIRVAALLLSEGQVLLVRHTKGGRHHWLLPGGGVARGEGLEEALVRELREELGAAGEVVGPPLALLETISPDAGRERHTVHIVFPALLSESTGTTATVDPAVKELRWFRTDELGPLDVRPPIQGLLASWSTLDLSRHRDDWPPLVHQRCPWTPEP